ncbi:hypothetical protein [Streptosporangium sp. V21-05]|uniref:hypothetical protein n=1 Tax=Streptosporangium sp. V21-05 TaxID=3446115 RepID=UPI003F532D95
MGLSILIVIIASVFLGVILGAILTRPRRWDLHICDYPVDHVRMDTAVDTAVNTAMNTVVDTASDRHG